MNLPRSYPAFKRPVRWRLGDRGGFCGLLRRREAPVCVFCVSPLLKLDRSRCRRDPRCYQDIGLPPLALTIVPGTVTIPNRAVNDASRPRRHTRYAPKTVAPALTPMALRCCLGRQVRYDRTPI